VRRFRRKASVREHYMYLKARIQVTATQHTATHCRLQHPPPHCNSPHFTTTHCNTATRCNTLHPVRSRQSNVQASSRPTKQPYIRPKKPYEPKLVRILINVSTPQDFFSQDFLVSVHFCFHPVPPHPHVYVERDGSVLASTS
jgi:hypothetical protein